MSFEARLRPERGLDVAEASLGDRQLAWLSGLGDVAWNGDWRSSWGGGLVTTCGLDNVGAPSEGLGLHGTYSALPARDVREEGDLVSGVIDDPRGLRVERTIVLREDGLELIDRTANVGGVPLEAPLLYHVNLGDWVEHIESDATEVVPRDADAERHDPSRFPPHSDEPERVWEHRGWSVARALGSALEVEIRSSLPRLWQWIDPRLGALGIEPANCSVLGRAHDRAEGRLPALAPGETRETWLKITAKETR
jgi:hypothetical protein